MFDELESPIEKGKGLYWNQALMYIAFQKRLMGLNFTK